MNSDNTPAKVGSMKGLGAVVEALCMCKDRALSACPGEWESGCDLGNNPKYVRVVEASRDEPTPALDCPAHGREAQRQQHEYDNRMDRARELLMRCDDGFGAYIMGRRMARKERDKLRGDIRKWLDA